MNFYGVGVMLGGFGTDPYDIMPICKEHGFWYMDFNKDKLPDKLEFIEMLEETIENIQVGDIIFAKGFHFSSPRKLYIRAIGRVTSKEMPDDIPSELKNKSGVSVSWEKYYENRICLESSDTFMSEGFVKGCDKEHNRCNTIFEETNEQMKLKIMELLFGDIGKEIQ